MGWGLDSVREFFRRRRRRRRRHQGGQKENILKTHNMLSKKQNQVVIVLTKSEHDRGDYRSDVKQTSEIWNFGYHGSLRLQK